MNFLLIYIFVLSSAISVLNAQQQCDCRSFSECISKVEQPDGSCSDRCRSRLTSQNVASCFEQRQTRRTQQKNTCLKEAVGCQRFRRDTFLFNHPDQTQLRQVRGADPRFFMQINDERISRELKSYRECIRDCKWNNKNSNRQGGGGFSLLRRKRHSRSHESRGRGGDGRGDPRRGPPDGRRRQESGGGDNPIRRCMRRSGCYPNERNQRENSCKLNREEDKLNFCSCLQRAYGNAIQCAGGGSTLGGSGGGGGGNVEIEVEEGKEESSINAEIDQGRQEGNSGGNTNQGGPKRQGGNAGGGGNEVPTRPPPMKRIL